MQSSCVLHLHAGKTKASSRVQNSLSKILEKVHLRYSKSSWRILQEFFACIRRNSSGRTASVLVGKNILRDVTARGRERSSGWAAPESQSHTAAGTAGVDPGFTWTVLYGRVAGVCESRQWEELVLSGTESGGSGPAAHPKCSAQDPLLETTLPECRVPHPFLTQLYNCIRERPGNLGDWIEWCF